MESFGQIRTDEIVKKSITVNGVCYKWDIKLFIKEPNCEYLYAFDGKNGFLTTLIQKDIIPSPYWIKGIFYNRVGYLCVKDIKEIIYEPCYINHSLKDDCIMISYGNPITWTENSLGYKDYDCDIKVWGREIIDVLKGAEKHSHYDISKIKEQIWQKCCG
jgi:hypothetical protein